MAQKIIAYIDGEALRYGGKSYNYYFVVDETQFAKAKELLEKAETIFNSYESETIELNMLFDEDYPDFIDGRSFVIKDYSGKAIYEDLSLERLKEQGFDEDDLVYIEYQDEGKIVVTYLKDMDSVEGSDNLVELAKKFLEANKIKYSMPTLENIEY